MRGESDTWQGADVALKECVMQVRVTINGPNSVSNPFGHDIMLQSIIVELTLLLQAQDSRSTINSNQGFIFNTNI